MDRERDTHTPREREIDVPRERGTSTASSRHNVE